MIAKLLASLPGENHGVKLIERVFSELLLSGKKSAELKETLF